MAEKKPKKEKPQVLGVIAEDSSVGMTWGLSPGEWFDRIGTTVSNWLKKGFIAAKQLVKDIAAGAAAIVESVKKGTFIDLLKGLIKENPVAAAAGAIAVVLIGGVVVGAIAAGVGAIAAALGGLGLVSGGALLAFLVPKVLQTGQMIVNFDFGKSDAALEKELLTALRN